tara:strand:+ start:28 stop:174 length:147 start_codon:yes stop_codon:yes gene_type:complete
MKKNICKKCYHDCHCDGDLHADEYGICTCENCKCASNKELDENSFNEV